jgi:hypothetical protein
VSWTTNFVITVPTNPEVVFRALRRFAGIPGEHPFTVTTDRWDDTQIVSEPGYFDALVIVWHHNGLPVTMEDDDPVSFVRVSFDTSYGYEGPEGDATDLHHRITSQLGEWCDAQGLPWATNDESGCVAGGDASVNRWRERTPAFAKD